MPASLHSRRYPDLPRARILVQRRHQAAIQVQVLRRILGLCVPREHEVAPRSQGKARGLQGAPSGDQRWRHLVAQLEAPTRVALRRVVVQPYPMVALMIACQHQQLRPERSTELRTE